jgi:hypothetical protein
MFDALVMSYSRLPAAMAQDGMIPALSPSCTPLSDRNRDGNRGLCDETAVKPDG